MQSSGYEELGCCPAWIYREKRLKSQGLGERALDTFDVRIGLEDMPEILPGDLICFGETSDMDARPEMCSRIIGVRKNSFGSTPHWHLRAEYLYR